MTGLRSNLTLGKQIGEGGFGKVHLAQDEVHGEVAVKVFRQEAQESTAEWLARKAGLLAEGQRLSQASHTNVVRVFYLVEAEHGDAVYLVMEYCPGGSLQDAFVKGPLPIDFVRRIATEVALGLHALHSRGMLHRDLKPGNVLLDSNGMAKIGDFGLVTDDLIGGYASQAGYLDHVAPEMFAGSGSSVKSDVWAFGMTIYRLLHGLEWYQASPAPKNVVPQGGFSKQLKWLMHIPKPWRTFIRKMLHDDPNGRHRDANQILTALATLPTEPTWDCGVVSADKVNWSRTKGQRRVHVTLDPAGRKYAWTAWSEPLKAGRNRKLGGSISPVNYATADRQLKKFFSKQT